MYLFYNLVARIHAIASCHPFSGRSDLSISQISHRAPLLQILFGSIVWIEFRLFPIIFVRSNNGKIFVKWIFGKLEANVHLSKIFRITWKVRKYYSVDASGCYAVFGPSSGWRGNDIEE